MNDRYRILDKYLLFNYHFKRMVITGNTGTTRTTRIMIAYPPHAHTAPPCCRQEGEGCKRFGNFRSEPPARPTVRLVRHHAARRAVSLASVMVEEKTFIANVRARPRRKFVGDGGGGGAYGLA